MWLVVGSGVGRTVAPGQCDDARRMDPTGASQPHVSRASLLPAIGALAMSAATTSNETPNEPIVTPTHINERALRYQVLVKRQLSRASRTSRDQGPIKDRGTGRGAARAERNCRRQAASRRGYGAGGRGRRGRRHVGAHDEVEMAPRLQQQSLSQQCPTSGEAGEIEEPAADPPPQEATEMEDADAAAQQQPAKPEVDGGDGPDKAVDYERPGQQL